MDLTASIDYNIYSHQDRIVAVEKILDDPKVQDWIGKTADREGTQRQLETLANYILYGKDEVSGLSATDTKDIEITTKHGSYKRKSPESLTEKMESSMFEEERIKPFYERNIYTNPKPKIIAPTIDKNGRIVEWGDAIIPGMMDLWAAIDRLDHRIKLAEGKESALPGETLPPWNSFEKYKARHILIEMRREQYIRKEQWSPSIPHPTGFQGDHNSIDWNSDSGYEREDGSFCLIRKHTLDYTNPEHVYHILLLWDELYKESYENLHGQMKWVLHDIEEAGMRTKLSPVWDDILDKRVLKWTNQRIADHILCTYGIDYNPNYISVIFKQRICGAIALTAGLIQREREALWSGAKWKPCSQCSRLLLIDPYNFTRKAHTKDGFSARCKLCDKKSRETKKRELLEE